MKDDNPEIEICPGITRRTVAHGKTMYQMVATLAAGSKMPAHSHPQGSKCKKKERRAGPGAQRLSKVVNDHL
jgi:hypothetical protein